MASLEKCIECGGLVSSQAAECPRCSTRYPLGVKCVVCGKMLRRSAAIKVSKDYGDIGLPTSVKFFHYDCHQQVSQVRVSRSRTSCPVCRHSIEFDTSSSVSCPNCGQKFPTHLKNPSFAPCCYCGFPLNKNLEVAVKEVQRQYLDGWVTETVYAHKICYTPQRQAEEQIQQKKEQREKTRATQANTNRLRTKKQAEQRRETLATAIILGLALGLIVGGLGGGLSHVFFGFGSSWKSTALGGFCSVSILTAVAVWIVSFFE